MPVTIIPGPPISGPNSMTREAAAKALTEDPNFPKGADFTITAHEGVWLAAVSVPAFNLKEAEFPPSGGDDDKGSDGPPSDDGAPSPDGPPSDDGSDDGSSDGPPSDGGDGPPHHDKGEHGDKGGTGEIKAMLQLLMSALGIDPSGMGDPSMAGGPPGGPGGPPPGPPHPGAGAGAPPPQTSIHERAMKPGETPPGGTPLGAPAFASVKVPEDHPWAHLVGKTAAFTVRESIAPDEDIVKVHNELQTIAKSGNFRIARFTPFFDENDNRHVEAVIQTPKTAE